MALWIALFRGINVGGNNILPMAELRSGLEGLGFEDVRTYIQSGNAVFRSSARSATQLAKKIADAVEDSHGFRVPIHVLSAKELESAQRKNPFPEVSADKFLHFSFLFEKPKRPDLDALAELATKSEEFRLIERVFYLHAPDGIGRSKLAARAEKCLGVEATGRNLRTVRKLGEMAAGMP
jgi:uncharacterized protein (DUF1697 family)